MTPLEAFSPDYATARERFRRATVRLNWVHEGHPIEQLGPSGEALSIDVARADTRDADTTLVVSSGLHGVEGFFGAAVQLALMEDFATIRARAARPRIVFVHALNPYGFAWHRRVNEDNVDLNRNFLLPAEAYAGSPAGYAALDPLLNPARAPGSVAGFYLQAGLRVAQSGMPALKQSVAAGQYDYPRGLFYGGAGPSRTMRILQEHLPRWIAGTQRIVHIDLHTGLGRWATYRLLLDAPISAEQRLALTMWCGRDALVEISRDAQTPASSRVQRASHADYAVRGGMGRWAARLAADYVTLVAEFGTYHPLRVLAGLRAENHAHHWSQPEAVPTQRAKARLTELFCPAPPQWRLAVLAQAVDLVHRALAALSRPGTRRS